MEIHENESNKIKMYIGPMYSSKTSEIIREYYRWTSIKKKVMVINHSLDNRYNSDDYMYTHDQNKIKCIKINNLFELPFDDLINADVILINEGQFFNRLVEFCLLWCEQYHKNIVVCGLNGDYLRKPFGEINNLICVADEVIKLKALCSICKNGTEALFTKRLTSENEQIVIGFDNYIPVCRKHHSS